MHHALPVLAPVSAELLLQQMLLHALGISERAPQCPIPVVIILSQNSIAYDEGSHLSQTRPSPREEPAWVASSTPGGCTTTCRRTAGG